MTATIACVLRSGGDFVPAHVDRLERQVRRHSQADTAFVCMTDQPDAVGHHRARPLRHGWPGWWSKVELFALSGPVLSLDLDVSITGDLAPLLDAAARHDLVALADFWLDGPHRINSSVMGWRGDLSGLLREFEAAPTAHMDLYASRDRWGDQRWLADSYAGEIARWQDLLPSAVVSFKRGALMGGDTSRCAVLVSHGKPRPWETDGADAWLARKFTRTVAAS